MKKTKLTWLAQPTGAAAQIYSQGLQYSLVNKNHEQCTPLIFCKDFLQDAIHGSLHNQQASIYGFTYNPKTMPKLDMDRVRIVVVNNSDKKFSERIPGVIDLLNQAEKRLKMKPTAVYEVSNPPKAYAKTGAYFFSGSGMWLNAPPLVSMYSLLLRVGFSHVVGVDLLKTLRGVANGKIKQYQSSDQSQMAGALKGMERIFEKGYRKFFYIDTAKNYPKSASIGTMHGSSGIVAFSGGSTKGLCKYWTRKSIDNPKPKPDVEKKPDLSAGTTTEG